MNIFDRAKQELDRARAIKKEPVAPIPPKMPPKLPIINQKPAPKPITQPEFQEKDINIENLIKIVFNKTIPNWLQIYKDNDWIGYGNLKDIVLFTEKPKLHWNEEYKEWRALHSSPHIDFFDGIKNYFIKIISGAVSNFSDWLKEETRKIADGNSFYAFTFYEIKRIIPITNQARMIELINEFKRVYSDSVDEELLNLTGLIILRVNKQANEWIQKSKIFTYEIKTWFSKDELSMLNLLIQDLIPFFLSHIKEYNKDKANFDKIQKSKDDVKKFLS